MKHVAASFARLTRFERRLLAASLTFLPSPYNALGCAANDVVLIVLWAMTSRVNPAYLAMILCFVMFLANDLYGFYPWRRIQKGKCKHSDNRHAANGIASQTL